MPKFMRLEMHRCAPKDEEKGLKPKGKQIKSFSPACFKLVNLCFIIIGVTFFHHLHKTSKGVDKICDCLVGTFPHS